MTKEIERRLEDLQAHPVMKQSRYQSRITATWTSTGRREVILQINAGLWDFREILTSHGAGKDVLEALDKAIKRAKYRLERMQKEANEIGVF